MNLRPWFAQGLTPSALGLVSNLFGRSLQKARRDHSHPTTPASDNATDFASSSLRWANGFFTQVRIGAGATIQTSGSGSPEGVKTAPVGSTWGRTDGGAGTSFYVKESGSGNTGWVAK